VKYLFILLLISPLAFSQSDEDKEFIELYLKIQSLEKEIASLRNEVEILETQVKFYQERNVELIDEIDSKLISLMSVEDLKSIESNGTPQTQTLNSYEQAIVLIQKGNLDAALTALNVYVQNAEESDETPLAYFWLGEINLSNGNLAVATQNFNTLIGLYPAHWRVPLAKYKLATIYLEQGDEDRAVAQFESVVRDFPESSAAKASRESLSSLE
jgi:TolA-binding protein|tara:strand:+ start:620 stop:1261 length:642 start_codon:yes stop_codon:yes gene_type:complete